MLDVLVLACGDSERFVGYSTPKQFLKFNLPQRPVAQMWHNVIADLTEECRRYIALRHDHRAFWESDGRTMPIFLGRTHGQADTLYEAALKLRESELLVVNCDSGFAPGVLDNLVTVGRREERIACLTFKPPVETRTRWSYVEDHPIFWKASEMGVPREYAMAGAYYLPVGHGLFNGISRLETDDEQHISDALAKTLGRKRSVEMRYEDFYDWGTPEALNKFMGYQTK